MVLSVLMIAAKGCARSCSAPAVSPKTADNANTGAHLQTVHSLYTVCATKTGMEWRFGRPGQTFENQSLHYMFPQTTTHHLRQAHCGNSIIGAVVDRPAIVRQESCAILPNVRGQVLAAGLHGLYTI